MKLLEKINEYKKEYPNAIITFELNISECCNCIFIDEEFAKVSLGDYITYKDEFIEDIDYLREVIEMEIESEIYCESITEEVDKRMEELKKEFKKYIVVSITD